MGFGHILDEVLTKQTTKTLYIAAPKEDRQYIETVKGNISAVHTVYTGTQLESFIKDMYEDCDSIMDNFHDIFSLVEQEMCFRSKTFYASVGSSWSLNIELERISAKIFNNIHNTNLLERIKT